MKPYHQQTYYELLEISPSATQEEIRAAYDRQMQHYAPDSVAIYSLADPAQAEELRKKILEAFEYLSDVDLRGDYDKSIGIDPAQRRALAPKPVEAKPEEPRAVEARPVEPKAAEPRPPEPVVEAPPPPPPPAPAPAPAPAPEPVAAAPAPVPEPVTPATPDDVPEAEADLVAEPSSERESIAPPPASGEAPSQLAMHEILNGTVAVASSNYPKVSVSYIPHPPRPERAEPMTVAAPSWSVGELPSEPASTPRPRTESGEKRLEQAQPEPQPLVPFVPPPAPNLTPPPMQPVAVAPLPNHTPPAIAPQMVAAPPSHTPPQDAPRIAEPIRPPPLPDRPKRTEQLSVGPEIAQESAIANAEAALAQVASRLREPRPKAFEVPPDAEFNGELLRKIRQSKNLSLQQVADRTKISSRHLENVEADRYDALPTTVYLRGIIMNIAREYGLDPLRVSKSYLALVPEKK